MSEQIKISMSSKTDAEAKTGHSIVYADPNAEKQYRRQVDF
jgi:hypothetical protein